MRWLSKIIRKRKRRQNKRYSLDAKLNVKCASWDKFADLFAADISREGIYINSKSLAPVGEVVAIELQLPEGKTLPLKGVVVRCIDVELARRLGKPAGMGVRLEPPKGKDAEVFAKVLQAAQQKLPAPGQYLTEPRFSTDPGTGEALDSSVVAESSSKKRSNGPIARSETTPPNFTRKSVKKDEVIVGIDLGTSYSSIAALIDGSVVVLPRASGAHATPSAVWYPDRTSRAIVGRKAKDKLSTRSREVVTSPKRLLGRKYDDKEVQQFLGAAAYESQRGPGEQPLLLIHEQPIAIPQVASRILDSLLEVGAKHLGSRPQRAVISVPVTFGPERVAALKKACMLAQLDLVDIVDEPSSAAIANRNDSAMKGYVGVYDFGGGTFDFSVVNTNGGCFEVISTAGDSWLGGDDFDNAVASAVANQFWKKHNVELRNDAVAWYRLLQASEGAKIALTAKDTANIFVPKVHNTQAGQLDVHVTISRDAFHDLCQGLFERTLETCTAALELVDLKPADMSAIFLSGGTTYMPMIRKELARYFGCPVRSGVPPEHAVCLGAAIHGAELSQRADATLKSAQF